MDFTLNNVAEVFIFILLCSTHVCAVLWLYGDMATRGWAGFRGVIATGVIGLLGLMTIPVLIKIPDLIAILLWLFGIAIWLYKRPPERVLSEE